MSVLKGNSRATTLKCVLTMTLVAVFIIGGLLTMSTALKMPFSDVAVCLADAANCANVIDGGGKRSGLGDGTNPGVGSGATGRRLVGR